VEEAIDPVVIEGFGHVEENRACQPLCAKVPGYSYKEAGQLQGRALLGSEPKMLVSQQSTLAYFM